MPRPRQDGRPSAVANKRALTKLFIERAKSASQPYAVWDTRQRGLALAVRPTGRKTYYAVYPFHGRVRWYRIADATAIDLDAARRLAQDAMYKVAQGIDPQAQRIAQRSAGTFEDLHDRYLEEYAKKRNKSWQQGDKLVRRYLRPSWAKLLASEITRGDVRAAFRKVSAPVLANQVLTAASAIFAWAIKQEVGGVMVNPCHGVERHPTVARDRILADVEVPQFWQAFDDAGLIRGSALKVLLLLGQRPGEVAHMRREHIKDGWWELPGKPDAATGWPGTKNGGTHRVWLPKPVLTLLAELNDGAAAGFVFSGERGGCVTSLDEAMRDICKALGVARATPHDLRRTHGSTVTGLGFGRDAMNRIQNHREGGIADVYDRHEYADENKRVIEAVASRIMALATGQTPDNVAEFRPRRA